METLVVKRLTEVSTSASTRTACRTDAYYVRAKQTDLYVDAKDWFKVEELKIRVGFGFGSGRLISYINVSIITAQRHSSHLTFSSVVASPEFRLLKWKDDRFKNRDEGNWSRHRSNWHHYRHEKPFQVKGHEHTHTHHTHIHTLYTHTDSVKSKVLFRRHSEIT